MDSNKNQILSAIESAKKAKNYEEMLAKAHEAVQIYPGEAVFKKHLHDAQAYYVDEKLESKLLDKLEEDKDWLGLQAIYLKLLSIFPESKELQKLLHRVKVQIQKSAEKERGAYFDHAYDEILKLIKEGQLEDAERACYEVLSYESNRSRFIHLLAKIQHLIDKEIEKGLSIYYKTAIPELKNAYKANKENYIRV